MTFDFRINLKNITVNIGIFIITDGKHLFCCALFLYLNPPNSLAVLWIADPNNRTIQKSNADIRIKASNFIFTVTTPVNLYKVIAYATNFNHFIPSSISIFFKSSHVICCSSKSNLLSM